MRPRGTPPTPVARSRPSEPVWITSTPTFALSSPSFMMAPLPNCFSICWRARSSALVFSLADGGLTIMSASPSQGRGTRGAVSGRVGGHHELGLVEGSGRDVNGHRRLEIGVPRQRLSDPDRGPVGLERDASAVDKPDALAARGPGGGLCSGFLGRLLGDLLRGLGLFRGLRLLGGLRFLP